MREVRTSVDYTIAGRQLSWIVVLSTTAATMVGGGASVGMVSQVYKIGIAAAVLTCAWHLQLIVTGLWIAPRLRGMNLITIGGFFELKFGVFARTLAVIHCILFLTGALTAQISAMGTLTSHVLELPFELSLLIASAISEARFNTRMLGESTICLDAAILFVMTNSDNLDSEILFIAGPDNTPCEI